MTGGLAETVRFGEVPVGRHHPAVLMVEVGTFFNQDVGLALEYLDRAILAGAPVFKTEILHDADVCLPGTGLKHEYRHGQGTSVEDYRALIERKIMPLGDYERILIPCRDRGVPFVASVYDSKGIDFLKDIGAAAIKIARNNIDNVPLIRHAARCGLPLIFDAGGVYLEEVTRAVDLARSGGTREIIINHHPGANPAPASIHNLRMIEFYATNFGIPVGLACHYRGDEILYAAIGAGANLLEKGFDADPDRPEQDLISAAAFDDLAKIIAKVSACSEAIGHAPVSPSEPRDLSTRAGFYARNTIERGERFNDANLGFAFPPRGISVSEYDNLFGARAARRIEAGEVIQWSDVRTTR